MKRQLVAPMPARAPRPRLSRRVTVTAPWVRSAWDDMTTCAAIRIDGVHVRTAILAVCIDANGRMFTTCY